MSQRLDVALQDRGLARSRARARDAILRGTVTVNGELATKPALNVSQEDDLAITDPAGGYVSRAALKLKAGLEATGWDPHGATCLDIGASTGGFTQVLAEAGANRIYAVDVGHGQLAPEIAARAEVISLEGTDARALSATLVPEPIDLLVCDASFVSVSKIIAAPSALVGAGGRALILIKPQFEVGRAYIGKGGRVIEGPHISASIEAVLVSMEALGWRRVLVRPSPIAGGDGNLETIAALEKQDG